MKIQDGGDGGEQRNSVHLCGNFLPARNVHGYIIQTVLTQRNCARSPSHVMSPSFHASLRVDVLKFLVESLVIRFCGNTHAVRAAIRLVSYHRYSCSWCPVPPEKLVASGTGGRRLGAETIWTEDVRKDSSWAPTNYLFVDPTCTI